MLKPHHGLVATERYNGDERSSRKPGVYIARAKQVAKNKVAWKAHAAKNPECADYINAVQIENRPVTYRDGHLQIA